MIALIFAVIEISIRVVGIYRLVKMEKSQGARFWKKVFLVISEPKSLGGPQKLHAKKIGSTRKVHPYQSPSQSSTSSLLSSNQTAKKLSHDLTSLGENIDFTRILIENTLPNTLNRFNSKNLLLSSSSPLNNSDNPEARNESLRESAPLGKEANMTLTFKSSSISRLRPRKTLVNRHYTKQELKEIIRNLK